MLKNDNGQWIEDVTDLQNLATNFYKKLFSNDRMSRPWSKTDISYPVLDSEVMTKLVKPISKEEVKRAIFNMKPWKAPGPDGFPAGFYQKSWAIVGDSVHKFVEDVWHNPSLIADVNYTDIFLIPKIQSL
jgi:hypothetical protein